MKMTIKMKLRILELLKKERPHREIADIIEEEFGVRLKENTIGMVRFRSGLPARKNRIRRSLELIKFIKQYYPEYGGQYTYRKALEMGLPVRSLKDVYSIAHTHGIKRSGKLIPNFKNIPKLHIPASWIKPGNKLRLRIPDYGVTIHTRFGKEILSIKLPTSHPFIIGNKGQNGREYLYIRLHSYLFWLANPSQNYNAKALKAKRLRVCIKNLKPLEDFYKDLLDQPLTSEEWLAYHEKAIAEGLIEKAGIVLAKGQYVRTPRKHKPKKMFERHIKKRYGPLADLICASPFLITKALPFYDKFKSNVL